MPLPSIASYRLPDVDAPPRVTWEPDPNRSALLIHDMQRYFVEVFDRTDPDAQINVAIRRTRTLWEAAHRAGVPVYFTAQPPRQDREDRALLTDFWGEGLLLDEHAGIVPELTPAPEDTVLDKWRYSAFMRTPFREKLLSRGRDQLIIAGVYAHIGCLATALDAFMLDIQPFFVRDALADFDAEKHRNACEYVAARCGRVLDAEGVAVHWGVGDAVAARAQDGRR